jgi:hypothetical protein
MRTKENSIPMRNFALEKVYPFIVKYADNHNGLTPTRLEIGKKFKFTKQQAHNYVKILTQEDLLRIRPRKFRGIVLIGELYKTLFDKKGRK